MIPHAWSVMFLLRLVFLPFQVSLFVVGPRGDVNDPSDKLLVCYNR